MEKAIEISPYALERGKPMPSKLHSKTQTRLIYQMEAKFAQKYEAFSELSLSLGDWDSVPDICIYEKSVLDLSEDEVSVRIPPLCTIEILSPTQSLNELNEKAKKYFEKGVKSCWLVIPVFKNIYVFSSPNIYEIFKVDEVLKDNILNISIPLQEVFV